MGYPCQRVPVCAFECRECPRQAAEAKTSGDERVLSHILLVIVANKLLHKLGISLDALIEGAYVDLLNKGVD